MEIKKISFLNHVDFIFSNNIDMFNDIIDVSVELEDGHSYVVLVATPQYMLTLMQNEKSDFLSVGGPMTIVKKLTKEIIEKTIKAYAEGDGYYLKFYGTYLDVKTLDVLHARTITRGRFLNDQLEKGESIKLENYAFIDFNIDNC